MTIQVQKYQKEWTMFLDRLGKDYLQENPHLEEAIAMVENWISELPEGQAEKELFRIIQMNELILDELGLDEKSVILALIIRLFDNQVFAEDEVAREFGKEIAQLLLGLQKINKMDMSKTSIHAENFIQLILSISSDVRVVLLKLADLLFLVRNFEELTANKRIEIARQISQLYAPIAHRLGLYRVKTEFEEVAMKYLESQIYSEISNKLSETKTAREQYIEQFIAPLKVLLEKEGYRCQIKGRSKTIHSIWQKMSAQGVDFEEVYDLFAIRIILTGDGLNEKSNCWQVYSIVTDIYQPNPHRLRDWISSPKINGYESLHTTVIGPQGKWVEVQIRTARMDEIAEKGRAAHWRYKEGSGSKETSGYLAKIQTALTTPQKSKVPTADSAKDELYSDKIYIFTPKGDLIKLRSGATILDFAFAVHTNVGFHCTGAKVNGRICPIKHVLINGDTIEILTSAQQKPKSDWLSIAVTSKARQRIKRVLKEQEFQDSEEGKETLKRKFEQWRIKYDVTTIHRLVDHLKLKNALNLYQQVAENKVDLNAIKEFLKAKDPAEYHKERTEPVKSIENFVKSTLRQEDYLIIDETLDNVDYKLAKCCNPIFGDDVFGFVTVAEGAKIHLTTCPNAKQMMLRYPYRVVKVSWTDQHGESAIYTANIRVTGVDDIGIVNQISKVISTDMKVSMRSMNISSQDGFFSGQIGLIVQDKDHLLTIIKQIKKLKGVISVSRSDGQNN